MTGSVKINSQAVCIVMVIGVVLFALYLYYPSKDSDLTAARQRVEPDQNVREDADDGGGDNDAKPDEVLELSRPGMWEEMKAKVLADKSVTIKEDTVKVDGIDVFYREGMSSKTSHPQGVLLFLHGHAFSSVTWKELATLHFMASVGYRPIAVDLPGYGKTKNYSGGKIAFMQKLRAAFELEDTPVIIISPSMSGSYSVPLLVTYPEAFKGFVPVAPVDTSDKETEFKKLTVPTCIIYGEKDTGLGVKSLADLSVIPNREVHELKGASHPAYLDSPAEFHDILLKFANRVYS